MATLHYASGDNIDANGNFVPGQDGFNLADVSSVDEVNGLPAGVKGLVWLDQGDGVTQSFIDAVKPYIGNPNVYGFFLKDEPDPTGQWGALVSAANLRAESDWIHANVPGAKTFITMMNMGSSDHPDFSNTYTPANTHIDLFGLDPYPVRSESSTVDYNMIDRTVAAAEAAGIPRDQMVPVFQTFGGGNWADDTGGHYVTPNAAQEQQILAHWAALLPAPAFDYAYAWGSQNGDQALGGSPELQNVFLQHNADGTATPVSTVPTDTSGTATPVSSTPTDTSGSATPVSSTPTDTSGSATPVSSAPTDTSGSATPVSSAPTDTSGSATPVSSAPTDTGGSTPVSSVHAGDHSHSHTHTVTDSTTADVASTVPPTSQVAPTVASTPTTTAPAADPQAPVAASGQHQHGLDFSQLAAGNPLFSAAHLDASTILTADAAGSAGANTPSSNVHDALAPQHVDLASLHGLEHTDHHASSWHW